MKLWDMNMRLSDEIGMYLTVLEMGTLTIVMCYVLYLAFKKRVYFFMKGLIILCIIADVGTGLLSIGLALETDPVYHEDHQVFVARTIGWDTLLFNWPTNLLHWFFGFKYWVISIEVPLALSGKIQNQQKRERFYMILNIFMIVLNTLPCFWVSVARYKLSI